MAAGEPYQQLKAEEIAEVVQEIRARVRLRHPEGSAGSAPLPDLVPILRARDAAEAKVAAIGTVNPRRGGVLNAIVQRSKRVVARLLDWHVREQVEFNRAVVTAVEAVLDALNENNLALARLADIERRAAEADESIRRDLSLQVDARARELDAHLEELRRQTGELQRQSGVLLDEARELKDVRRHWAEWRQEWEKKLSINEVQFLRGVADLESAFQHRATLMEANFRDTVRGQHRDFEASLDHARGEIQTKLWEDLGKVRTDFERLIHAELRLVRQRAALGTRDAGSAPAGGPVPAATPAFDPAWFAERFRGTREYVRESQRFYVPLFQDCAPVLDLGCGRGEFLELMKEAGIDAQGVDASEESVAQCVAKGLKAEAADLFAYLEGLPEAAMGGIFCCQVVEHLPAERVPGLIKLAAAKLSRGGLLAVETPNPECLASLAVHFYLDPTHQRPVPSPLLKYYFEEAGLGGIEIRRLSPAVESMPSLASLPEEFREAFFGGLDYAILGRKL